MNTIKIRDKPFFEIVFNKEHFEVRNDLEVQTNGVYYLKYIESAEIKANYSGWVITIISFFVTFFMEIDTLKVFNRKRMSLKYKGQKIVFDVTKCNKEKLNTALTILKKNSANQLFKS